MKQQTIFNTITRGWGSLPLIFKSALSGFLVSSVGIAAWTVVFTFLPAPWSVLTMIPILWLYWKYFSGIMGRKRIAKSRGSNFRNTILTKESWKWGLSRALLFVLIVQASFVVTFRLINFPADKFTADYKILDSMPVWAAWIVIVISAVVAGICEETGFRGYMQAPLEKRYGPVTAIILTSALFMLIHLSHSWALPILPHIFFASVLLGILAYRSGSLIPGIIGHSILDIFNYSVWWSNLTGKHEKKTIFYTGIDLHFIAWALVLLISLLLFFKLIGKLKKDNKESDSPSLVYA